MDCLWVFVCVLVYQWMLSVHSFICEWESFSCSLLYLSVLRAEADRADVDNYKVFSQRANFGDVCLHLPLSLSQRSFLPTPSSLSCGSGASQGTTTPQTLSTIFKSAVCVSLCVCLSFFFAGLLFLSLWLQLSWYISFGYPSFQLYLDAHTLNYPHLCAHIATFQYYKLMFCNGLLFNYAPKLHPNI